MGNTTCTVQESGNLRCTGVDGEIPVEMSGEKPTSGTITFTNGKITNLSSYVVGNTTYKLQNGSLVVDDSSEEETEPFTGTIYRNSTVSTSIGDSIAYDTISTWCEVFEGFGNSCDFDVYFNDRPECEEDLAYQLSQMGDEPPDAYCDPQIEGLAPGSYYTEQTKSNITTTAYLMHEVEDNIVMASYVCLKYSQNEEPACVKGADPNEYGSFDGMIEGMYSVSEVTGAEGNIAEIAKTRDYFLSNGGSCHFDDFNSNCHYGKDVSFGADLSGEVYAHADSVECRVNSDGSSYCKND